MANTNTKGVIAGFDFYNDFNCMRYWSFPSSYSDDKKKTELSNMLYSNQYLAAEKKDGYWERIIKDDNGDIFMCSRSKGVNGVVEKVGHVPHLHDFINSLPNGTCLVGEVYIPGKTSKNITSILGCLEATAIKRQAKDEDKLIFYAFDVLAYNGTILMKEPMMERVRCLRHIERNIVNDAEFVECAEYWETPQDIHKNWLNIISNGGEGVVMVRKDYPYEMKKKAARKTLKLKKELEETLDVFLTGKYKDATFLYTGKEIETWEYWYNTITEDRILGKMSSRANQDGIVPVTKLWYLGLAGSIEVAVMKDNKVQPLGWISNISEEDRGGIIEQNEKYKGRVMELQAMEINREGAIPTLRHAKPVRWRDDKTFKECLFDQLM